MISRLKSLNKWEHTIVVALIIFLVIAMDRICKYYVEEFLRIGESIPVIGEFFMITRVNNTGAAFGLMKGYSLLFIIAGIVVVGLFIYYYNEIIKDYFLIAASTFILGGTIGNMIDRVYFGYVVDYLDIGFWPTFNLSDFFLTIGVIILSIFIYSSSKEPEKKETKYRHY